MSKSLTSSITELQKERDHVLSELDKVAPALTRKLRLTDAALDSARKANEGLYSRTRNTLDAIELCLKLHGAWMSRDRITAELIAGGFPVADLKSARMIVGDSVKHNWKPGKRLAREPESELVGLSSWVGDKTIPCLNDEGKVSP